MRASPSFRLSSARRRPLAACVAALFGIVAPPAMAILPSTVFVDTCAEGVVNTDSTHGSLRWALANVADPGTIDMTGLACSTISLQTGKLTVAQNNLTIKGPGMYALDIRAKYNNTKLNDRVFDHTGTGTFKLYDLEVSKGYYHTASADANGGCINSKGSVYLKHVYASSCEAKSDSGTARGGAVYAAGTVQTKYSTVSGSTAYATSGLASGGGVYAHGSLGATGATIKYNAANNASGTSLGFGGGVTALGTTIILASTISGNTATARGAGAFLGSGLTAFLVSSTISGNTSSKYTGGVFSEATKVYAYDTTVAFNTAAKGGNGSGKYYAPGFASSNSSSSVYMKLKNSLFSNNTYGSSENDLSKSNAGAYTTTFNTGPAANFVRASFVPNCSIAASTTGPTIVPPQCLPPDTIRLSCPLLGPLRNNGGPTKTHALLSTSPAIDVGLTTYTTDQRLAPYVRPSGPQPDIGAYEVQQDDIVFDAGFDGCPVLF